MTGFYLRWGVIILIGLWIVTAGAIRYSRDVRPMSPDQVLRNHPAGAVRIIGRVEAGSLLKEPDSSQVRFSLVRNGRRISVVYQGSDSDLIRELKTLVLVGKWAKDSQRFMASQIHLVPNYGFITAAYLVMIPLAIFLFLMERRVRLLYNEIKLSKTYEPESEELE
jgi:cytochrome c-type biogenesis protein CcmE